MELHNGIWGMEQLKHTTNPWMEWRSFQGLILNLLTMYQLDHLPVRPVQSNPQSPFHLHHMEDSFQSTLCHNSGVLSKAKAFSKMKGNMEGEKQISFCGMDKDNFSNNTICVQVSLTILYLTCIHGSMTSNHYPAGDWAIDILQVLLHPFILRRPLGEVMLCAHHHKVNTAIVKTVPGEQKTQLITWDKRVR